MRPRRWCQLIFAALYGLLYWYQWRSVYRVTNGDGLQYMGLALQALPGVPVGWFLQDHHLLGVAGAYNTAALITVALVLIAMEVVATGWSQSQKVRAS